MTVFPHDCPYRRADAATHKHQQPAVAVTLGHDGPLATTQDAAKKVPDAGSRGETDDRSAPRVLLAASLVSHLHNVLPLDPFD
jgi:hypothetical protein